MALFGKLNPPKPDPSGSGSGSTAPVAPAAYPEGAATAAPSTPDPEAGKAKTLEAKPIPALAIRAIPPAGFWRAGRHWPPEIQTVAVSEFTKAQVEALREEANLVVEDVEITPELEA